MPSQGKENALNRRQVLNGLSGVAAVGLAGCSGLSGDDGDSRFEETDPDELGERVPEVSIQYWTAGLRTPELELMMPIVQENLEKRLGLSIEVNPVELTSSLGQAGRDAREDHMIAGYFVFTPEQLDPNDDLNDYSIFNAGAQGAINQSQYASCEFTEHYEEQLRAPTEEARREAVHNAMGQMGEDRAVIPIMNTVTFGLTNSNTVDTDSVGLGGNAFGNPRYYINSEPTDGDTIVAYALPGIAENVNFPLSPLPTQLAPWAQLVHSPLLQYDENFELQPVLADTFEVANQSTEFTIELVNHEFHDGTPVTAEDVEFTIDHLLGNADQFPQANPVPEYEIELVDDTSLVIEFEESVQKFRTADVPMWGILNQDFWVEAGADENPRDPNFDGMVGSGPFELTSFSQGEQLVFSPADHPVYDVGHTLIWQIYSNKQSAYNAFENEEIDIFNGVPPSLFEQGIEDFDFAEETNTEGIQPFQLSPQIPEPPMKFRELRDAIGKALNRREISQVALLGKADPFMGAIPFSPNHPWYPDDVDTFTDDPAGDGEAARQVLSDAGWGWDSDGNLHYPQGADLDPLWSAESAPSPEDYPCLE